jgi:hypothetical protein
MLTNKGGDPVADVAIAYGWTHEKIFKKYDNFVYFDLGFWDRKPDKNPKEGNYRVAVNNWSCHVNMRRGMPDDRWLASGIKLVEPVRRDNIVIACMSQKGAKTQGFEYLQWEKDIYRSIRTSKRIVVREKPVKNSHHVMLDVELLQTHAVVTQSSNVAVDALIHGNIVYAENGVGKLFSISDLDNLDAEKPVSDAQRVALLSDIAYSQYTPAEMRSGLAWEYVRENCISH